MKPKDLKPPFCWAERRVVMEGGVLYVPDVYRDYGSWTFPGWSDIFGNTRPVSVEYCAGNGEWIASKAAAYPEKNWVAVEKRFDRVRKIWAKRENHQLKNLFIVCGEAHCVTSNYFPAESVGSVYINFPDPWPKQRHAKHRLVHPDFLGQVDRILVEEGRFMFVTDHADYASRFVAEMDPQEGFRPLSPPPHFVHDYPGYGESWFERLWRERGLCIHYCEYQKVAACGALSGR